jgi:hypothetical protein
MEPILACEACGLVHYAIMTMGFLGTSIWVCWSDIKRYWGI